MATSTTDAAMTIAFANQGFIAGKNTLPLHSPELFVDRAGGSYSSTVSAIASV